MQQKAVPRWCPQNQQSWRRGMGNNKIRTSLDDNLEGLRVNRENKKKPARV